MRRRYEEGWAQFSAVDCLNGVPPVSDTVDLLRESLYRTGLSIRLCQCNFPRVHQRGGGRDGGDDDPTIYVFPLTRNWTIFINVVRLASQSVSLVRSSLCRHLVLTHRVGWMVGWRNLFVGKLINAINLEANSWAVTDDDRFNEMSFSRSFFPRLSSCVQLMMLWGFCFWTDWVNGWLNEWLTCRTGWLDVCNTIVIYSY